VTRTRARHCMWLPCVPYCCRPAPRSPESYPSKQYPRFPGFPKFTSAIRDDELESPPIAEAATINCLRITAYDNKTKTRLFCTLTY
jgi:hypothetical protein